MRFLAKYIMRGRMQAMTVASTLAFLSLLMPPISIVSSATIALVTLRRGAYDGLYVLLCSSAAASLLGLLILGSYQFGLVYGAVLWLPIWLISTVLREGRYLSLAMEIAVILGVIGILGFYAYADNPAGIWQNILFQMVQPMLDASPETPVEDVHKTLVMFSKYMTGVVASGAVYGLLFGLFLGRWWQSALYNPGGFRSEFLALKSQPRVAIGSILVVAVASISSGVVSELAWNISILLFVLFTFMGVALLHALFSGMKAGRFLVPLLYLALFMIPHIMLIAAFAGLIDTWLNLRSRNSNKTST